MTIGLVASIVTSSLLSSGVTSFTTAVCTIGASVRPVSAPLLLTSFALIANGITSNATGDVAGVGRPGSGFAHLVMGGTSVAIGMFVNVVTLSTV